MKHFCAAAALVVLSLRPMAPKAQSLAELNQTPVDKPLLFATLPNKIECSVAQLENMFAAKQPASISFSAGNLVFTGDITERVQRNRSIVSINIRSTNFPGALFTVSRITETGQPPIYSGTIIHPRFGDSWMITKENDRYFLIKQKQKFFMTE